MRIRKVSDEQGPEVWARLLMEAVGVRRDIRDKAVAGKASALDLAYVHELCKEVGDKLMAKAAMLTGTGLNVSA